MPDITFNDNNNYKSKSILSTSQTPGMAKFLINKGIVKNEKQARGILLTIIMVFFISSFVLIYLNFFRQPEILEISPEERALIQEDLINITQ